MAFWNKLKKKGASCQESAEYKDALDKYVEELEMGPAGSVFPSPSSWVSPSKGPKSYVSSVFGGSTTGVLGVSASIAPGGYYYAFKENPLASTAKFSIELKNNNTIFLEYNGTASVYEREELVNIAHQHELAGRKYSMAALFIAFIDAHKWNEEDD